MPVPILDAKWIRRATTYGERCYLTIERDLHEAGNNIPYGDKCYLMIDAKRTPMATQRIETDTIRQQCRQVKDSFFPRSKHLTPCFDTLEQVTF